MINCFIDSYEHSALKSHIDVKEVDKSLNATTTADQIYEYKPHFHEWATALPGGA